MVVSISFSNKNHLIEEEHNCFNSSMCVPFEDVVNIPSRKLKDEDIRWIASTYEGRKKTSSYELRNMNGYITHKAPPYQEFRTKM